MAPHSVPAGLLRWTNPNTRPETTTAPQVPISSSTRRNSTPRNSISSAKPATTPAANTIGQMLAPRLIPVIR